MKTLAFIAITAACGSTCMAQIHVDRPLVFTAPDPAERTVEGLGPATNATSLIGLTGARSGRYHWGQASGTAAAIILNVDPPCTAYTNGLELRFMPVANSYGPVTVNVNGLGARKIYRTDGLQAGIGELTPGNISSLVYTDTAFFLMDRARGGCPPGFLDVNSQYCIQHNDTANLSIFNAARWCSDRGARLCSWGEYMHACLQNAALMEGMFDDWEWVDDTADHTHTAVQVARWTCVSEQSWSAVENANDYARVRCCYTLH